MCLFVPPSLFTSCRSALHSRLNMKVRANRSTQIWSTRDMFYSLTIKACILPHAAFSLLPLNRRHWMEQRGCTTCLTHCLFMSLFHCGGVSLFFFTGCLVNANTHSYTRHTKTKTFIPRLCKNNLNPKILKARAPLPLQWSLTTACLCTESSDHCLHFMSKLKRSRCLKKESKLLGLKSVIQTGIEVKNNKAKLR